MQPYSRSNTCKKRFIMKPPNKDLFCFSLLFRFMFDKDPIITNDSFSLKYTLRIKFQLRTYLFQRLTNFTALVYN